MHFGETDAMPDTPLAAASPPVKAAVTAALATSATPSCDADAAAEVKAAALSAA